MGKKQSNPNKRYVVWEGVTPGVYRTWSECQANTNGVAGAKFKSFPDPAIARQAFLDGADRHWGKKRTVTPSPKKRKGDKSIPNKPTENVLTVDGAFSDSTKKMEYRCVWLDGSIAFASPIIPTGTNNLAEFMAIVAGLRLVHSMPRGIAIYSDSLTALAWLRTGIVKSPILKTDQVTEYVKQKIEIDLDWLRKNTDRAAVHQWHTKHWGDIPADYGRK